MLVASSSDRSADQPATEPIHQVFVTHCLYDEGIYRQAGFTVRAASTRDPLFLRFAQEYPHYELPAGMPTGLPPADTPRRLALVRVPGGPRALIHSVDLPGERHGRANNFFSQVLIAPNVTPRDVLRMWASPGWTMDCSTTTPKVLEPATEAFPAGPLNDQLVTDFLQPDFAANDRALATLICPERLQGDVRRRRELLSLTLRGCLLALQAIPGAPRSRLFLLAEPGLAALLLYGAVRLLPPHLSSAITFSTYESLRQLRTYRHAQIVAAYPGQVNQELDEECFTSRGYAIDTFRLRSSPDLKAENNPTIEEWMALASQGNWKLLDTVYHLVGNSSGSVVSFQEAFQAARLAQRVGQGKADPADLLALKRSPWGPALLEQHREKLWPLVRDASLRDPGVQAEFADVLVANLPELEQKVADALRNDPPGEWQPSWRLIRLALKGDLARLRDTLQRILPPSPYSPAVRFAILPELQDVFPGANTQLPALHGLLRQCTSEDLEQFRASELPREWYVWALCYALIKGEAQATAVRHLQSAGDDLLRIFWEQFKLVKEENQRRALLAPLISSRDASAVLFFGRSLKVLVSLRLDTLEWILTTLGALDREWSEFWCSEDRLPRLLDILRGLSDEAEGLWHRLLGFFDAELLLLRDPFQRTLLVNLAAARDRPGPPLPPKPAQAIADWVLLREHFEKACTVPENERAAIIAACQRNIDAIAVLKRYFERFILPQEITSEVLDDFAGFFDSFYPPGADYQDHASRLLGWCDVVACCPDEVRRETYRHYYLDHRAPVVFRERLAEEVLRTTVPSQPVTTAPAPVPAEVPLPASAEIPQAPTSIEQGNEVFQLTGIGRGDALSPGRALLWGTPWLLCSFASGLLAVYLFGFLKVPPRQMGLLCSFIPLILAVADSAVVQSLAVGLTATGCRRHHLVIGLLCALGVGVGGGGVAWGAAQLFAVPPINALCVGIAVAAAMVTGSVFGLLAALIGRSRRSSPAVGPIVRALTGAAALGLYVVASRWLL